MIRTTGEGFGVDDEKDPTKATNNKQGVLSKIVSLSIGYGNDEIRGAIMEHTNDVTAYGDREWNPMLIDFMPVSELPDLQDKGAYLALRTMIADNIREGLLGRLPDMTWHGAFYNVTRHFQADTWISFYDDTCGDAYNLGNKKDRFTNLGWRMNINLFEPAGNKFLEKPYCPISLSFSIAGKVLIDNVEYWTVVSQISNTSVGVYYIRELNMSPTYSGHVLNPTSHRMFTVNATGTGKTRWKNPYPFVSHKGKIHMFDLKEKNTKPSI
jgi:hypothetical protein